MDVLETRAFEFAKIVINRHPRWSPCPHRVKPSSDFSEVTMPIELKLPEKLGTYLKLEFSNLMGPSLNLLRVIRVLCNPKCVFKASLKIVADDILFFFRENKT